MEGKSTSEDMAGRGLGTAWVTTGDPGGGESRVGVRLGRLHAWV